MVTDAPGQFAEGTGEAGFFVELKGPVAGLCQPT